MTLPYRDPALPVHTRVADLLTRMTLAEKVAQLIGPVGLDEPDGRFQLDVARRDYRDGISYVNTHHNRRGLRETIIYFNRVQQFLIEETRLGIPAMGFGEGLHGYMAHEATSFPQAIGLASAWDVDLHRRVFEVVAREMRARGAQYVLSPVLDLARDPRWGRTEETYGEDPYLVSRLGVAAVQGLQGERFTGDPEHVLATAKHFAAHGQPEGGTNAGPANYAERVLREEFLAPFQAVVQEAGIGSVMASYNEINGIPSHINPWLLGDVLRGEWGFTGFVISDGWGVDDLYRLHQVAADAREAARKSFLSGVQVELGHCFLNLVDDVQAGRIDPALLDAAVAQVLALKFRLGLFEQPFVDGGYAQAVNNCSEHKTLALEAAHKSIVLLKNAGNLLPLDQAALGTLAVIGPNADAVRLGGYSGSPGCAVTVLEGIRQKVGQRVRVLYAEGCGLTQAKGSPYDLWVQDEVVGADPKDDDRLIMEAVQTATLADVILLVLGDNEQTCREGWSESHLGDRDRLDLPGRQEELLRQVVALGKPTILLLIQGRPASIESAAEHVSAILEGWYLGQAAGTAVADVLFGDVNPSGKLPITFPRSVGQIPAYYYHKPSARRGYLFSDKTPLFPFGHGLSYTTFRYANLRLEDATIGPDETTYVTVDITNTGVRAGDEVAQLYIHDLLSEQVTRPVKLLKGFRRVHLEAGETASVCFPVGPAELAFLDGSMQPVVEPGEFEILIGGSSAETQRVLLTVVAA